MSSPTLRGRNLTDSAPVSRPHVPVIAPRKRLTVAAPSGQDSLAVRERFLKQRRTRRLGDRGLVAVWVTLSALGCWLFVAGFAGLSH